MRLARCVVLCASLSLTAPLLRSAPATAPAPAPTSEVIAGEIGRLADDSFRVREDATRKLWLMGAAAAPKLREALQSGDPEVIKRATFVLRRLDFDITPEMPAAVVGLIEQYNKTVPDERMRVIMQLAEHRAWRQILKLYGMEKDPEVRSRIRPAVASVAIQAAREAIVAGRPEEARAFLEMGPEDSQGLLPLAEFHRTHGTLKAELAKGSAPGEADLAQWKLALNRASGDIQVAGAAARGMGEKNLAALFSLMEGNPLLWMDTSSGEGGQRAVHDLYRELAIKHWKGELLNARDLEAFEPLLRSGDEDGRRVVTGSLFLLGQTAMAEPALAKQSPVLAFMYYDLLERIPEALRAIGLDPVKPDYAAWIAKRFKALTQEDDEMDQKEQELIAMAVFLERRGLLDELKAYEPLLVKVTEMDSDTFLSFLGKLFGDREGSGSFDSSNAAITLAKRAAATYAVDDDGKWEEVLLHALGQSEELHAIDWWRWLGEIDPAASRAARFEGVLSLFHMGTDPNRQRDAWLKKAWAAVEKLKKDEAAVKLQMLADLAFASHDVPTGLKAWDQLSKETEADENFGNYLLFLSAAGRWDRAADLWLKIVEKYPIRGEFHAYAAGCLRRLGKTAEANAQDALADQLALGDTVACVRTAQAYSFGGDFARAGQWFERAVLLSNPGSEIGNKALQYYAIDRLDAGDWKRAAALYEALAFNHNDYENVMEPVGLKLRLRVNADLARAMSQLKTDRAGSIAILEQCHKALLADGSLADYFYPALRKAGLLEQHDAWFEQTWAALQPVLKAYPACDNTRNTAAWLAARAVHHLDEAEALVNKSLASSPGQAAYLDTKAEIYFSRKDRQKAVELSRQSLDSEPFDEALRRQYERYQKAPFLAP